MPITSWPTAWRARRPGRARCWNRSGRRPGAARWKSAKPWQALIAEEGGNFKLAPWDWRYYAEKLRERRYDFDEAALKPYFELAHMIAGGLLHRRKIVRRVVH